MYRRVSAPVGMMMGMPGPAPSVAQPPPPNVVMPPYMRPGEDQMQHVTHVPVPEQQLSRLIGPSGEGLKDLQQQTGAYLNFMPHVQGEPYIVAIQGLPQQILLARSLIQVKREATGKDGFAREATGKEGFASSNAKVAM